MESMKVCCKCGKLMSFNSRFDGYYCTSCGRLEEKMSLRKVFSLKKSVVVAYAQQK